MNNKEFKEKVQAIEVPDKLDFVIRSAMKRGRKRMKRDKTIRRVLATAAGFLIFFTTFAVGINMVPALAAQIEQLPGGSSLVRILQPNREPAAGGEITDGQDIESVEREPVKPGPDEGPSDPQSTNGEQMVEEPLSERITITLGAAEDGEAALGYYEVTYHDYPYQAVVYLSGVRGFSAMDDLANMEEGPLVLNAYRLITLDDSAHRFVITFKQPVTIEITEKPDLPGIILNITEETADQAEEAVYSLRSLSQDFGETVAVIEEVLRYEFESKSPRMLRDIQGTYLIEEGYYGTEAEALARMAEINDMGAPFELVIEKREAGDIPGQLQ